MNYGRRSHRSRRVSSSRIGCPIELHTLPAAEVSDCYNLFNLYQPARNINFPWLSPIHNLHRDARSDRHMAGGYRATGHGRVRAGPAPAPGASASADASRGDNRLRAPRDRDAARAAGFDLHLIKPVDVEELQQLLARGTQEAGVW